MATTKARDSHKKMLKRLVSEYGEIFSGSRQAIYAYFDDAHMACNKKLSSMLGYASPKEWAAVMEPFPLAFVAEGSRRALIGAYRDAMEHQVGSKIELEWVRKDGGKVKSNVILVPVSFEGHLFALHFVGKK